MEGKDKRTDDELVEQYHCSRWSHRAAAADVMGWHEKSTKYMSDCVRNSTPSRLDVPYGTGPKQKLDIFGEGSVPDDAPIFVFIHGGYWHCMGREYYSFVAEPLVQAGALVVLPGYDLAPQVSLGDIVKMVKECIGKIFEIAQLRGSRGVYLSGHSAGGHLAAAMLCQSWTQEELSFLKGAVLLSGVFDVRPALPYLATSNIVFTQEEAWEWSPMRTAQKTTPGIKCLVIVGGEESQEFQRQSLEYYSALKDLGIAAEYLAMPDRDHFDLVENLLQKSDPLTKILLDFVGLEKS